MKKFALISLAVLLALSLCACTGLSDGEDSIDDYAAKSNTHILESKTGTVTFTDGPKETAIISGYTGYSDPHKVVLDDIIVIKTKTTTQKFPVTGIGDYAFYQLTNVTEVVIPETVTFIGKLAFAGCTELTTITIPASVEYIDDCAFAGCTALTTVIFEGTNVKYIDNYAFEGCENLTEITLPEGLEEIGEGAFGGCKSLTSIKAPETLKEVGTLAFYGCDGLNAEGALKLNASIEKIGQFAFAGINRENVSIPEGLEVKDDAFGFIAEETKTEAE